MKPLEIIRLVVGSSLALAFTCTAPQTLYAAPTPKLHFTKAVTYDSGGPFADSVAVADLRGSGKLDLVVLNLCQSSNGFSCVNSIGEVSVLLGNGDGSFQPSSSYSTGAYFANSVAVRDVNGDGVPDIVVAHYCQSAQGDCGTETGAASVLLGKGDGTFQLPLVYSSGAPYSFSVTIGDLNGDGTPDLVLSNIGGGSGESPSVSVLLGNGDGTFRPPTIYPTNGYVASSVVIKDLNRSGIPDLIVTNFCQGSSCTPDNGGVGVLRGNGDGTFQPVVLYDSGGIGAYSLAVADLRGNGVQDIVVANRFKDGGCCNTAGSVSVLLGNGDGTFQSAAPHPAGGQWYFSYPGIGWGTNSLAIADVDGDGIPDALAIGECQRISQRNNCAGTGRVNVLPGNGDGSLQAPIMYSSAGAEGSASAIADVDGDGRPDLIATNACGNSGSCSGDGSVAVLLNKTSYKTAAVLVSSPNPSHVNQSVTFTATITSTPAVPDGETVTFYNGKTKLGTGTTKNGVASLITSFATADTYTIKASYAGDAFRKKSTGTVKQVVNP